MRNNHITHQSLLLLLLSIMSLQGTKAQINDFVSSGIPYGLSASNLSETPVNYLTGVPHISVPLTSITNRDITVDVTLSYDASGIKVSQEASTVGLGWNLNAGGLITRDARGGKYDTTEDLYTDFVTVEWGTSIQDITLKQVYNPNPNLEEAVALYNFSHDGREINSPDIFSFSFCGHSGKFYIDGDLKGHLFSFEEIDIQLEDNKTFTITDDKGIVYTFKDLEFHGYGEFPSAWYLTSIVSPKGGKVEFKYADATSQVYRRICGGDIFEYGFAPVNQIDFGSLSMRQKYLTNKYEIHKDPLMQVESIVAGKNKIIFGLESGNKVGCYDGEGTIVNSITQFNSLGNKVKEYKFNYESFGYYPKVNGNGHKTTVVPIKDDYSSLSYSLKLTSVEEVSPITGKSNGKLEFSYHGEEYPFYYHLPARNGYQDHYGYSNSNIDSPCDFLFPNKSMTDDMDRPAWYRYIRDNAISELELKKEEKREFSIKGGANREPDGLYAKAGTLKRVTYPEGGWTEYEYEKHNAFFVKGNDSINKGGIRVKSITSNDGFGNEIKREYSYNSYYWFQGYTGDSLSFRYFTVVDPEFSGISKYRKDFDSGYYGNLKDKETKWDISSDEGATRLIINPYPVPDEFENGFIYTSVTETLAGNGKTEYRFSCPNDADIRGQIENACPFYKDNTLFLMYGKSETDSSVVVKTVSKKGNFCFGDFPYLHIAECPWAYGDLIESISYDEGGHVVSRTEYEYEHKLLDAVPSYKIAETGKEMKFKGINTIWSGFYCVDYLISGISRLKKITSNSCYGAGITPIKTVMKYEYGDSLYIDRPTLISKSVAGGDSQSSRIYYTDSYIPATTSASNNFKKLQEKHIVVPIDIRTIVNGKTVGGKQIEYNNAGQPVCVYSFVKGNPEFNQSKPYTFMKTIRYDYKEGLLFKESNMNTSETFHYIWGYDNQYPFMKIYNYEKIVGKPFSVSSVLLGTEIQAPYESYEYIPSVGLSRKVMSDGSSESYEYDEFYRLKRIRKESSKGSNKTVIEYSYGINE